MQNANSIHTISVQTPFGGIHAVANYANGKLAIWKRSEKGALFSEYPAREVSSLKQAKAQIQAIYFNEKVI
ncbi:hypothetical protein ACKLNO_11135 [Neisseriaceae bacterium B1]